MIAHHHRHSSLLFLLLLISSVLGHIVHSELPDQTIAGPTDPNVWAQWMQSLLKDRNSTCAKYNCSNVNDDKYMKWTKTSFSKSGV
jgi:hypothetical protein